MQSLPMSSDEYKELSDSLEELADLSDYNLKTQEDIKDARDAGHREPTHDKNNKPKEWLKHCGKTAKMILMRKFNPQRN